MIMARGSTQAETIEILQQHLNGGYYPMDENWKIKLDGSVTFALRHQQWNPRVPQTT